MGSLPSTNKTSSINEIESELKREIQNGDTRLLSKFMNKIENYVLPDTPYLLHFAAFHGHSEWVKYLIDQNLDVNGTSEGGETPLHACIRARHDNQKCAEIILKAKGNINAKNVWGRTALMEAIVQFKYHMVDYLLSQGADINLRDIHLTSPLHVCASYGKLESLRTMLACGANLDAQDERGRTPLYFAVNGNHYEVATVLIENNCNVNLFYGNFGSPLQKALTLPNIDLVQSLLMAGASASQFTSTKQIDMRLSLMEIVFHIVQSSTERCIHLESAHHDSDISQDVQVKKTLQYITCFKLLVIACGLPIKKSIRDRLKLLVIRCQVEVIKKELVSLQVLVNAVSLQLNKGPVDTLSNIARYFCRLYLMASKRNVIWACGQMDIPAVLVNLLTFRL